MNKRANERIAEKRQVSRNCAVSQGWAPMGGTLGAGDFLQQRICAGTAEKDGPGRELQMENVQQVGSKEQSRHGLGMPASETKPGPPGSA